MKGPPFTPCFLVVTEDLVYMLESMGLSTGIDVASLVKVRRVLENAIPNEPLHSAIATAGLPLGFASARLAD